MAIVPNKDGQGVYCNGLSAVVDRKFATPNAGAAGYPSTQSAYASELRVNGTTGEVFRAMDNNASTLWVETNIR